MKRVCLSLLVVLCIMATAEATRPPPISSHDDLVKLFDDWAMQHQRSYATDEEKQKRLENFKATYDFVDSFYKNGGEKEMYTVGLNGLADMTDEELHMTNGACFIDSSTFEASITDFPVLKEQELCSGQTDWSAEGMTGAPREQSLQWRACGSCWAMATVGAVEAANRQTYGPESVVPLSPQQLVSCDTQSDKCQGTKNIEFPYRYIMANGGLSSEEDWPYTATNGTCKASLPPNAEHSSIAGYTIVQSQTDTALHNVLCDQPAVALVQSNSSAFRTYTGGIFMGECGPTLDHAVLVVGTFDAVALKYFKFLNSWGTKWGEEGYMRIIRYEDDYPGGHCGISSHVSYPKVPIPSN